MEWGVNEGMSFHIDKDELLMPKCSLPTQLHMLTLVLYLTRRYVCRCRRVKYRTDVSFLPESCRRYSATGFRPGPTLICAQAGTASTDA